MSDLRSLIMGKGSEAALGVDKAKASVEEAKLNLEAAKNHLSDANAIFDAVLLEMEEAGLSKSKAKKAIDEINQTLLSIGILAETAVPTAEVTAEKTVRRKRKGKNEDDISTEDGQPEVTTVAETVIIANVEGNHSEINRGEADEIVELILSSSVDFELQKQEEIHAILNDALELAIITANEQDIHLDLDFFAQFLDSEVLLNNVTVADKGFAKNVYAAFCHVIEAVEMQVDSVHLILGVESTEPEIVVETEVVVAEPIADVIQETVIEEEITPSSIDDAIAVFEQEDVIDENEMDEVLEDDHYLNHYEEPDHEMISDDESFPMADAEVVSEVSVVSDVSDMNFFEEVTPVEVATVTEPEAPKATKLAPPSFLKKPTA